MNGITVVIPIPIHLCVGFSQKIFPVVSSITWVRSAHFSLNQPSWQNSVAQESFLTLLDVHVFQIQDCPAFNQSITSLCDGFPVNNHINILTK